MGRSRGLNRHSGLLRFWPKHANPARSDRAKSAKARRAGQRSATPTKRKLINKIKHRKNHKNNNKNHSSHPPVFLSDNEQRFRHSGCNQKQPWTLPPSKEHQAQISTKIQSKSLITQERNQKHDNINSIFKAHEREYQPKS